MADDLWGELPKPSELKSPRVLLEEQATFLGRKTNQFLQARVLPVGNKVNKRFSYDLEIVVPALDDYFYSVFRVTYDVGLYPVACEDMAAGRTWTAHSETELLERISETLRSPKVQNVISALLAEQTRE
jgi:hypothetical protein